jgi:hypothetical protein
MPRKSIVLRGTRRIQSNTKKNLNLAKQQFKNIQDEKANINKQIIELQQILQDFMYYEYNIEDPNPEDFIYKSKLEKDIKNLQQILKNDNNNVFIKRFKVTQKKIHNNENRLSKLQAHENKQIHDKEIELLDKIKSEIDIPFDESLNFENWKLIANSGQHNCGIFINEINNKVIMKCESSYESLVLYTNLLKKQIPLKCFPEIYRYNIIKVANNKYNYYYEMERFNSDATQLLFEILLKKYIEEYNQENSTNINIDTFYGLFHIVLGNNIKNLNIQNIVNYQYNYDYIENKDKNKYKDDAIETINNIYKTFVPLGFNFETYKDLISQYKIRLLNLLQAIIFQITILQNYLYDFNIILLDLKCDNFGIIFKDNNEQYFGKILDNNKFYESYFFVYILDYESSISKYNMDEYIKNAEYIDKHNKHINNIYSWNFYGQYNLNSLIKVIPKKILVNIIQDEYKDLEDMQILSDILNYKFLKS